jgi:hypothetical protein
MTESDVRKPITRRRVSKSCVRCGSIFEVIQARKDSARYCGRACFSNRRSSTCETCGVAFDYPASAGQRRFCGMGCRIGSQCKAAPEGMKWCSMGQHFTTIQSFGKSRFRRDGLLTHCKPCKKAYETSRAEINRRHRRAYRARNPEKATQQRQKWADANKDRMDEIRRNYAALHPEKVKATKCRSRAKRAGAIGSHSHADWLLKVRFLGWRCHYCGITLTVQTLTKDHRRPLSKGGTNFLANLAPACAKCNSAKRARSESEFRSLRSNVLSPNQGVNTIASGATTNSAA